MTIALLLTIIAAIAGALSAAARTATKLKSQMTSYQPNTVQEAKFEQANQTKLQPDLDSERPEPVEAPEFSESEASAQGSEASTIAIPSMMPIAEPDISLATSLRISDVVESDLSIESKPQEHHHTSVLEEIGQLDHSEEQFSQLQQQATDSDHLVRLTVAVELGEMAKQGQASDRVVALLNQLMQDADMEVRVQAGTALAMIPMETIGE
ncbi:HEAT repeat domain-containing protein [Leptolyngbya sp. DQ-M1]|uniref:HEAT repeat domain-containing protein n=1 Tax=Leptolyngbya sp. DQ-M1 TaxID=2933920 RepID=UPI003296AB3A